jgi:hypothetical protein
MISTEEDPFKELMEEINVSAEKAANSYQKANDIQQF